MLIKVKNQQQAHLREPQGSPRITWEPGYIYTGQVLKGGDKHSQNKIYESSKTLAQGSCHFIPVLP